MKHLLVLLCLSLISPAFSQDAHPDAAAQPGKNFTNSQGMTLIWAGDFWIGEKEVTQGQFAKLGFKDESSWKKGEKDAPVNNVSWVEALKFCQALQSAEKETIAAGTRYLLPTVAQWRKARKSAVKDMDGGVSEWCLDKFTPEMAQENRAAGIANAYVFMPASTAGLYCVLGTSWKNSGADFAKGILPLPPISKAVHKGKGSTEDAVAVSNRLTDGEIGFRVVLVPATK